LFDLFSPIAMTEQPNANKTRFYLISLLVTESAVATEADLP
jgi:hypothetical protein